MSNIDSNTMLQLILYGWLLTVLLISSVTDLRQRRIPNLLTYPTIVIALLAYWFIGGLNGVLFSLGGMAFGFVVFLAPHLMGGMGAGDVKLMCAVGAVLGFLHTVIALFFIAIAGGIIALGLIVYRGTFKQTLSRLFSPLLFLRAHSHASPLKVNKDELIQDGIPFGLAITSGVCLSFVYLAMNKEILSVTAVL